MCRMFAYVGTSRKDVADLYASLKNAAKYDRTLTWMPESKRQHKDGWGCAIYTEKDLFHYRTQKPIFEDLDFALPEISGTVYAIFHARAAGGSPIGSPVFSHPFVAVTDKETIFMSHNGALVAEPSNTIVDSELALRKIAEKGLEDAAAELKPMTKSALDLFVLSIDRGTRKAELECMSYWSERGSDKEKDAYYQLFEGDMSAGKAVFSSTMADDFKGAEACPFGRIIKL